jgi:hypothetical protein
MMEYADSGNVSTIFAVSVWLNGDKSAVSIAANYNRGKKFGRKERVWSRETWAPSRRNELQEDAIAGTWGFWGGFGGVGGG